MAKETLEKSAELCIGALSQAALDYKARYIKLQQEKVPDVLKLTVELRMDILFIQIDLCTSFIACCKAEKPYACRYHIKNLYAGMQEAFKLLHGYGKSQHYTIWTKIGESINGKPTSEWREQPQLESLYKIVSAKLDGLSGTEVDKVHRDLTYHYDCDMKRVYSYTLKTNNLEKASSQYCAYLEVLTGMTQLCDEIESCLRNRNVSTAVEIDPPSIDNGSHLFLIQYLSKNKELPIVLEGILNDIKPIDDYALQLDKFDKLNGLVSNTIELPEIDNILVILNMQLTIYFIRADMAAITQSFLLSKTSGEAMLNMRRYIITITAAFSHLYGYSEDEQSKSIWASIMSMIPEDATTLKENATNISNILKKVVLNDDMNARTCYAHLYDNKTRKTNVPSIIDLLLKQDPIKEIQKVTIMLKVTKLVIDFSTILMDELSIRAREAREKSTEDLKTTLLKIKGFTELPNCPIKLKEMLCETIGKVQGMTGIII